MLQKMLLQVSVVLGLFLMAASPQRTSAANVMNYGADGMDYFQFTTPSMAFDKASGFTTLITFAMHVNADGTLLIGGVACTNGVYVGPTNWNSLITTLKTPPTTVTRYEVCIGGWTDTSFDNIQSLVASQGTGPASILYKNFQALKNAVPGIDAINDDDEQTYDLNSSTSFANMLGVDEDFRNELTAKRTRLAPTQISSDGRIMEWLQEYAEPEPQHRHVSHLWGLYPGDEISLATTPALAQAARKSLEVRGDDGVGWSLAYKAALWARLGDGNHAWLLVRKALFPVTTQEVRYDNGGGVYVNLFDACPPFQIDGNFGVTATIGEMLLQSQLGKIKLLPALPDAWKNGKVSGLRARGGFQVDEAWQNGKLISATIHSVTGKPCSVSYGNKAVVSKIKKDESITLNGNLDYN
jgi:hypothetical protein